jgi:hypothetical protein
MTRDEYIKKLCDLRKYLKENPELIPVYSDININKSILITKRKIYESERDLYVENRLVSDEFIEAYDVPF